MDLMKKKVVEYGGTLEQDLSMVTTHIVCPPEWPAEAIADKLKGCPAERCGAPHRAPEPHS
jgi:hypothetical protein